MVGRMKLWSRYLKTLIAGFIIAITLSLVVMLCISGSSQPAGLDWLPTLTTSAFIGAALWLGAAAGAFIALLWRDRGLTREPRYRARVAAVGAAIGTFAPWLIMSIFETPMMFLILPLAVLSSAVACAVTAWLVTLAEADHAA